jgi:hypothetical protein
MDGLAHQQRLGGQATPNASALSQPLVLSMVSDLFIFDQWLASPTIQLDAKCRFNFIPETGATQHLTTYTPGPL